MYWWRATSLLLWSEFTLNSGVVYLLFALSPWQSVSRRSCSFLHLEDVQVLGFIVPSWVVGKSVRVVLGMCENIDYKAAEWDWYYFSLSRLRLAGSNGLILILKEIWIGITFREKSMVEMERTVTIWWLVVWGKGIGKPPYSPIWRENMCKNVARGSLLSGSDCGQEYTMSGV